MRVLGGECEVKMISGESKRRWKWYGEFRVTIRGMNNKPGQLILRKNLTIVINFKIWLTF